MKHSHKYVVSGLLAVMLLLPSVSSAQGNEATIVALMEQIKQLQAQITALQMQQQAVQNDMATVTELAKTLREGARGDDVRTLQAFLASDPTVYPEAVISGQYGRMTTNAVKRFQRKHGLEADGSVNEMTLQKLNAILAEDDVELIVMRSGTGTDAVVCRRTPPGHFIAPGWTRKRNGNREIIPDCQTLPPGIAKKLPTPGTTTPNADVTPPTVTVTSPFGGAVITGNVILRANASDNGRIGGVQFIVDNSFAGGEDVTAPYTAIWNSRGATNGTHNIFAVARDRSGNRATSSPVSISVNNGRFGAPTTTPPQTPTQPDTSAPVISAIGVGPTTTSSAVITWTTNEAATTRVYYSTSSPVATSTATFREVAGFSTSHTVNLTQLTPGTTYHVLVVSVDSAGNMSSIPTSFTTTTTAVGDTTAPQISNLISHAVQNTTATITWTTNEAATTRVYYSTVSPVATGTAPFQEVSGFRTSHSVTLPQLIGGTTYFLVVVSTDAAGNMSSMSSSFITPGTADTTPPSVFSVTAGSVGSTTANISWMTTEAATAKVYYGTTNPLLLAGSSVVPVTVFATSQNVNLSSLSPSTTYQYVVVASDAANNSATSSQHTFTTMN